MRKHILAHTLIRPRAIAVLVGLAIVAGCSSNAGTRLADLETQRDLTVSTPVVLADTTAPPVTTSAPEQSTTTSSSPPANTVQPPEGTSTTSPAAPIGLQAVLEAGEPFRYSYSSAADLPDLPAEISGYVAYVGDDRFGLSGRVRRSEVRVFEWVPEMVPVPNFSGQTNSCDEAYWVLRWVSTNPDVKISATNELGAWLGPEGAIEEEPWLLPPPGVAGLMGNNICYTPGFRFDSIASSDGNLIDVAVEWIYFDRDPFAVSGESIDDPTTSCINYRYDDELPISVCSQGFSVELFQEVLGVEADGYFGPGTEAAVRAYQESAGLPANGVMDATTWASLGVTVNAPYPDLNGDGVIDGSEFSFG